jgi:hypothetical protein
LEILVAGKFLPGLFPEIYRLSQFLLFEAGIPEIVIEGAAVDSSVYESPVDPLGGDKISLLIGVIGFGKERRE